MTAPSSWPYPRWLAHRGGGALAPENTLAALEVGAGHGYRAAEVDAVLSADDVPVLLHDATLERTSNARGLVSARTAQELSLVDAGSWYAPRFAGAGIPTLRAALEFCCARGIWLNIEIKPVPGADERTGRLVARLVEEFWRQPQARECQAPLLSSFSTSSLRAARAAAPGLARGLLVAAIPADWPTQMAELECSALHCDHRYLTPSQAQGVRAQGFGLMCYTVNDPERAAALRAWGVDAVCTDRIDRLVPA